MFKKLFIILFLIGFFQTPLLASGWKGSFYSLEEYRSRLSIEPAGTESGDAVSRDFFRLFIDGHATSPQSAFTTDVSLGLWEDTSLFGSETSTQNESIYSEYEPWWNVFNLSMAYQSDGALKLTRVGRQVSEYGTPLTFDGATTVLKSNRCRTDLFLFGGRSVHFFETDSALFEDWLVSTGTVTTINPSLQLELDYRFLSEQTVIQDNSYGATLRYRYNDWFRLKTYAKGLNTDFSNAGFGTWISVPSNQFDAHLLVDAQMITLNEINEAEDPYYSILGESLPNIRWKLGANRYFETTMGLIGFGGGFDGKYITQGDEQPFNRNSSRLYAQILGDRLFKTGFYGNVGVDYLAPFMSTLANNDIVTGSFAAGYKKGIVKTEVGTYYQQYKYDYYADVQEIADVRTVYGEVALQLTSILKLKTKYQFERSYNDIHSLTVTLSQLF